MRMTLCIATMNEGLMQLIPRISALPVELNVLIVHQITDLSLDVTTPKQMIQTIRPTISVIQMYEKGLSKSRNCALSHVHDGIAILTDDDVEFTTDSFRIIQEAYEINPDADIITFQAKSPEGIPFKKYPLNPFRHTYRSVARVSSIEITINRSRISSSHIRFDERFGLGAVYPTSEEYIFLADAIKTGLHLRYSPYPIAIHPLESSGKHLNDASLFAKGAVIRRTYPTLYPIIIFAFALKKYSIYKQYTSGFNALKNLYLGAYNLN